MTRRDTRKRRRVVAREFYAALGEPVEIGRVEFAPAIGAKVVTVQTVEKDDDRILAVARAHRAGLRTASASVFQPKATSGLGSPINFPWRSAMMRPPIAS